MPSLVNHAGYEDGDIAYLSLCNTNGWRLLIGFIYLVKTTK